VLYGVPDAGATEKAERRQAGVVKASALIAAARVEFREAFG
jgi:hypothetical protein